VDLAGNTLHILMKVRREPHEMEIGILALRYAAGGKGDASQRDGGEQSGQNKSMEKNTIEFAQLRGRGENYPLLAIEQQLRLRQGEVATSFEASWDVLHDETEITERSASGGDTAP
jgi:hypothetical protein